MNSVRDGLHWRIQGADVQLFSRIRRDRRRHRQFCYKSGTNQFHGTLFDTTKPYVQRRGRGCKRESWHSKDNQKENNFGGTIGGPIRKDHTFFFFNYEGDRFRSFALAGFMTLPTSA